MLIKCCRLLNSWTQSCQKDWYDHCKTTKFNDSNGVVVGSLLNADLVKLIKSHRAPISLIDGVLQSNKVASLNWWPTVNSTQSQRVFKKLTISSTCVKKGAYLWANTRTHTSGHQTRTYNKVTGLKGDCWEAEKRNRSINQVWKSGMLKERQFCVSKGSRETKAGCWINGRDSKAPQDRWNPKSAANQTPFQAFINHDRDSPESWRSRAQENWKQRAPLTESYNQKAWYKLCFIDEMKK